MKRNIIYQLIFFLVLLFAACDGGNYNSGYNTGYEKGKNDGYEKGDSAGFVKGQKNGYVEGHKAGFIEGLTKSDEATLKFASSDTSLWEFMNWISIIAVLASLFSIVIAMIRPSVKAKEWKKTLAKVLVLLLSLLASYFILPQINFIWYFNTEIVGFIDYLIYIAVFAFVFFIGMILVKKLHIIKEILLELFIIFVSSFMFWFMIYLLLHCSLFFGDKPLFGNNLIICVTLGIICILIYSLLYPRAPSEKK